MPRTISLATIAVATSLTLTNAAPAQAQGFSSIDLAKQGRTAYHAGNFKKAVRYSKRVALTKGRNQSVLAYAYETLCMTYDAQGKAADARKACAKAIGYDSSRKEAAKLLAAYAE